MIGEARKIHDMLRFSSQNVSFSIFLVFDVHITSSLFLGHSLQYSSNHISMQDINPYEPSMRHFSIIMATLKILSVTLNNNTTQVYKYKSNWK